MPVTSASWFVSVALLCYLDMSAICVAATRAENICASVKRDVAELCQSSATLQALVQEAPTTAGRQAGLAPSAQVRRAVGSGFLCVMAPTARSCCTDDLCLTQ